MKVGSSLVVFDSSLRENFYPLTYTRPCFDLIVGTGPLYLTIETQTGSRLTDAYVPDYLEASTRQSHPKLEVNQPISNRCIVINSLISPRNEVWDYIRKILSENNQGLYVDSLGNVAFGLLEEVSPDFVPTKKRSSKTRDRIRLKEVAGDLGNSILLKNPWELVEDNSRAIFEDYSNPAEMVSRSVSNSTSFETMGKKVMIDETADIERYVTLDSRNGPVIIGKNVEIQSFSRLTGPCFVGNSSKISSAKIRQGTTIGSNCKVSGEVEQTIICDYSNKSHDGFLGHSIVGSWVNVGALTTNSDLKNTYGNISFKLGRKRVDTGSIKVGVFLGDMSKTAIGTLITAGKKIGVGSQVFGTITEDVPSFTMYAKSLGAKSSEIFPKSAILTQRRMMERRGVNMTDVDAALMMSVFKMTKRERIFEQVKKRRFKLT